MYCDKMHIRMETAAILNLESLIVDLLRQYIGNYFQRVCLCHYLQSQRKSLAQAVVALLLLIHKMGMS